MNTFLVTVPFALFSMAGSLLAGPETNAAQKIQDRSKALVRALDTMPIVS